MKTLALTPVLRASRARTANPPGILLTQRMATSPEPIPLVTDFWAAAYAAAYAAIDAA